MAFTSGFNDFDLGIDRSVLMVDSNGTNYPFSTSPASLGRLISFESKSKVNIVKNPAISDGGIEGTQAERMGWTGVIKIDRGTEQLDLLEAQMEQLYHAGQNQLTFTIHETTYNRRTKTTTRMRYDSCTVTVSQSGTWGGTAVVEQQIDFEAATRTPE